MNQLAVLTFGADEAPVGGIEFDVRRCNEFLQYPAPGKPTGGGKLSLKVRTVRLFENVAKIGRRNTRLTSVPAKHGVNGLAKFGAARLVSANRTAKIGRGARRYNLDGIRRRRNRMTIQ